MTIISTTFCFIIRLICGANSIWYKCQPSEKPTVYYANHSSHLDFPLIWASMPENIRKKLHPIAGKDYWNKNWIKRFISCKIFNSVLIERFNINQNNYPIDKIAELLKNGDSILIFPEGTRGLNNEINQFKNSLFHLYKKCPNVQFVPIYLNNLNRILPKGEFLPVPILSSIIIGQPLVFESHIDKTDLINKAKFKLEELKKICSN